MDDLKLATEQELRTQYFRIDEFITQYRNEMSEEEFYSPANDYMFEDEEKRMGAIVNELDNRGLLGSYEKKFRILVIEEVGG